MGRSQAIRQSTIEFIRLVNGSSGDHRERFQTYLDNWPAARSQTQDWLVNLVRFGAGRESERVVASAIEHLAADSLGRSSLLALLDTVWTDSSEALTDALRVTASILSAMAAPQWRMPPAHERHIVTAFCGTLSVLGPSGDGRELVRQASLSSTDSLNMAYFQSALLWHLTRQDNRRIATLAEQGLEQAAMQDPYFRRVKDNVAERVREFM